MLPADSPPDPVSQGEVLFKPKHTTVFRVGIAGLAAFTASVGYAAFQYYHSNYWNRIGYAPEQPVLFSHRHHAKELRIDCRYCHTSVETGDFAGLPATQTCLTCHSQIFTTTPMLRPVVKSAELGRPIHWNRVTRLPDHVYFNHSIHIAKGVGCTTCHGEVGNMALLAKGEPLTMRWCIDCHRNPGPRLRPREEIFAASETPVETNPSVARERVAQYGVHTEQLTNCSTCHH